MLQFEKKIIKYPASFIPLKDFKIWATEKGKGKQT